MRRLPEATRLLGERYKTAAIMLRQRAIESWEHRVKQVDRSHQLRSVYAQTLEQARAILVDRSAVVAFFKNSIATEWGSVRRGYPKGVREKIRNEIIGATGLDPHAMYLASQGNAMRTLAKGQIQTSRQFRVIEEFMGGLDSRDRDLEQKCQRMLDDFETRLMSKPGR